MLRVHAARYSQPARVTFGHVFFTAEAGEQAARTRAGDALAQLTQGTVHVSELGDPFPDRYHFAGYEPEQVHRLFGRTEFSEATLSAPLDQWAGPFRSSYGWHLLHVEARVAPKEPDFATVRDAVRTDYLLEAQTRTNAAARSDLAKGFTVVRERS
jgi:peptidyl-prolyl cis-trans isomerase C